MSTVDIVFSADQSEGTQARLERWLVAKGGAVTAGQAVAELETDKVTLEIAAPENGVIGEILIDAGQEVEPGTVLAHLDTSDENATTTTGDKASQGEATAVLFPADQSEGTEASLSQWLVSPGQTVTAGQPVAEIETDKVALEVVAPVNGTLVSLKVEVGQGINPGDVLAYISATGSQSGATPEPLSEAEVVASSTSTAEHDATAARRLSPSVRRLLREHNLTTLPKLIGSGRGGRVTRDDLAVWLKQHPHRDQATAGNAELPSHMVPHSGMRRRIAQHMVSSLLHTAPHVTSVFEVDLSVVLAHRKANKANMAKEGVALTYTAYFLKAAAHALKAVPAVNARYHEDALEVFEDVNIGVGTALGDEGLIVPVVRKVQQLDLFGIAQALTEQTERARSGRLTPEDLKHGTFTISNHGVSGSLLAAPIIINQPQVAILGIGKMEKRVRVITVDDDDQIEIRPMCYVSLSIDHRALDAHQTNQWLSAFVEVLENWAQ